MIPPKNADDPRIEGLRALAAWMVVGMHYQGAWGLGQGGLILQTGVNLFFVLSGFVFGRYVWGAPLALIPHALRRLTRLWPLYLTAVALYALAAPVGSVNAGVLLKHALMLHTWEDHALAGALNAAFWSLPPEVEFYVLLPLLAWARGPVLLWFGLALLVRWALAENLPTQGVNAALLGWAHLPGIAVEFLAGALAWRWAQQPRALGVRLALGGLALAAWLALAVAMAQPGGEAALYQSVWSRGKTGLWAALIYALAVAACLTGPVRLPALASRGMLAAGALSYGVYLLHNLWPPLLKGRLPHQPLLALAAGLLLTAASAWLGHRWIEKPARAWGRRRAANWAVRKTDTALG